MKVLLRVFATVHGLMAILFACAALLLIVIAARIGWTVFAVGLDRAAAQGIPYAASLLLSVGILLAGWGVFVRLNRYAEELEPEAMEAAKREDKKLK